MQHFNLFNKKITYFYHVLTESTNEDNFGKVVVDGELRVPKLENIAGKFLDESQETSRKNTHGHEILRFFRINRIEKDNTSSVTNLKRD